MDHIPTTSTISYSDYNPGQNSQQQTTPVVTNRYDGIPILPFIGQTFLDLESGFLFYCEYIGKLGSNVRHSSSIKARTKVHMKKFCYSKQGRLLIRKIQTY